MTNKQDIRVSLSPEQQRKLDDFSTDPILVRALVNMLMRNQRKLEKEIKHHPIEAAVLRWLEAEGDNLFNDGRMINTKDVVFDFIKFVRKDEPNFTILENSFGRWFRKHRPQAYKTRRYIYNNRETFYCYRWLNPAEIEKNITALKLKRKPTDRQIVQFADANRKRVSKSDLSLVKASDKDQLEARRLSEEARERRWIENKAKYDAEVDERLKRRQAYNESRRKPPADPSSIFGDLL